MAQVKQRTCNDLHTRGTGGRGGIYLNHDTHGHDLILSAVPEDGIYTRFSLMLIAAWELYLHHGMDINLGDIISHVPLHH